MRSISSCQSRSGMKGQYLTYYFIEYSNRYGIYTIETADLNYHRMTAIRPFQNVSDVTTSMRKIAEFIVKRRGWLDPLLNWTVCQ